jgi:acyl-CoA hydrolase
LVSTEILRDGATVQIGIGDVSAAMPVYFDHLHDLGIQTEIIPGGIADLVDKGVVTGRFKELRPGKVVGTAFVQLPPEEVARVDGNDTYELYDFTYTDDLTNLLTLRNFYAINNALAVDVTGNVSSESMGPQIFSGPGGQTVFAVAAATVNAGSVIVLPSSEVLKTGERVSRIVPALEAGTTITVHRAYVDYVVTEQGIARLTGKSIRQRIDELLAVSHPDLRPQLREEVQRLYAGRASNAKN